MNRFKQDERFKMDLLEATFLQDDECISVWEMDTLSPVYVNPPFFKAFGFDTEMEMLDSLDFNSIRATPPAPERIGEIFSEINESGIWNEVVLLRRKNGEEFYGKLKICSFTSDGRQYLIKKIYDIDHQVRIADQLRKEIQRFEALFHYATMGIILTNRSGDILLANRMALELFGYNREEMFRNKVENLIPNRFRPKHEGHRKDYETNPQNRPMGLGLDLYAIRKDGSEFPVEISLGHFQNEDDWYVIAFIIDITKRKEIEFTMVNQQKELERINKEIEELNDELEIKVEVRTRQLQETLHELELSKEELEKALSKEKELGDLKSRFVSMASHEFRTPLSTILSSASLVAKYQTSEEQDKRDKHILRIKSAVNNLTDILNEFLSIGRIEEGKIQPSFSVFDINKQMQLVCNEMLPILKKGQQIRYSHEGENMVSLDLSLLRNVLINLISNAVKFSQENGIIEVKTRVRDGAIQISVRDFGIGIPDEDKKHLFERFFRAKNVTNIQGTGLGLHIVSRYVELMGGKIEVESEIEKGTEFICTFNI